MARQQRNFWVRALDRVRDWRRKDDINVRPVSVRPELSDSDVVMIRRQIDACLADRGGAVSARLRAAELGRAYLGLNDAGQARFFSLLASEYDIDPEEVDKACAALGAAEGEAERRAARRRLRQTLVPPRVQLLTQFNSLDRGVKFLVDMRADLLRVARGRPEIRDLDGDLQELLRGWFDVGFLEMAQITFNSPASLLEKLIDYEAVHEIRSWKDLKNRLDSDRRCFSFMHPNMPGEPLIFVEVALVNGMTDNVHALLDEAAPEVDPHAADTAIFYSISNCQAGLAGVGFGDFLIKRVVDRLSQRFPNLKTFATLSPIPGFRRWLDVALEGGEPLLAEAEERLIRATARKENGHKGLKAILGDPGWADDGDLCEAVREPLIRLGARYLALEKDSRGRPLDPVARFHLNNGARVERINWLGDRSESGLRQSAGMMVNYLYKLDEIEKNHEAFRGEGKLVASPQISRLCKGL